MMMRKNNTENKDTIDNKNKEDIDNKNKDKQDKQDNKNKKNKIKENYDIKNDKNTGITNMKIIVNRGATRINANVIAIHRNKIFFFTRHRIKHANRQWFSPP